MRRALGLVASIGAVLALLPSPAQATTCVVLEDPVNGVQCVIFTDPVVRAICDRAEKFVDC
jgi:hypothetical protein